MKTNPIHDESGVALVLTVFVISLATILVVEFANTAHFDQRISRHYSESVQGDYILKSGLNFARILLELPKIDPSVNADWLNEPWNAVASSPALPIEGFVGEPRLGIYDEDGKIDINGINGLSAGGNPTGANAGTPGATGAGLPADRGLFWKNALKEIFELNGFVRESYKENEFRTRGHIALDADVQVAAIQDWIDRDTDAYSFPGFTGSGIESSSNQKMFYNRTLRSLSELLLVPGFTRERLERVARFIRVSPRGSGTPRVNVNTAPPEVLQALGLDSAEVSDIVEKRLQFAYTPELVNVLVQGNDQLANRLKTTSNEFSVLAKVEMPASTRWLRAFVAVGGRSTGRRRSTIVRRELY